MKSRRVAHLGRARLFGWPTLCHFVSGSLTKLVQNGLGKARVAVARKMRIRLWIMLRDQIDYEEFYRSG
jgi:hypothetical protein